MQINIDWSPAVAHADVQFEHTIRSFLRGLRMFKKTPDNEESLIELWSELLRAKLLYNNVCVDQEGEYKGATKEFYAAVQELDSLLPKGEKVPEAVQGIRRQLKEIKQVHVAHHNNTKDAFK